MSFSSATKNATKPLQSRLASTTPFFPVQPSPSLPPPSSIKPPSSLWYTARPSLSQTLVRLEQTLTQSRKHLFQAGLLPSISTTNINNDAVLPHPRQRRWKAAKDMAAYLRTGTDLKMSHYKRLTALLAGLEGLLPYANLADSIARENGMGANAAPSLVVDPVSVATGRTGAASGGEGNGQSADGLERQLELLLARFQQPAAVSALGVAVERVEGKDRRLGSKDEQGRVMAVGRRKESGARVWIIPTQPASSPEAEAPLGRVLVNTLPVQQYFSQSTHRHEAIKPLSIVDALGGFNVFALVKGGGQAAQADAVAMGVARALSEWERVEVEAGRREENELTWRDLLRRADLIERDPRVVERKKTGLVKARKRPTWVKR
ncbi:hypothetical protein JCM11641_005931 [Rhodosporidiobolus odoratus]